MLRRRRATRPTLSLSITTRDAGQRLGWLLAEARQYADEIVVGVDRDSVDETFDVATAGADRVFRFVTEGGVTSPGRIAGLERARGDWILWLDDDEGMDAAFPALRDELLATTNITHWCLPRKWLTSWDPPEYLHADPWWPNWAVRLARADVTRIWKPLQPHSGLRVIGPRGMEPRTSILHYERLDRGSDERAAKVAQYRVRGSDAADDYHYDTPADAPRGTVDPPPLRDRAAVVPACARTRVDSQIDDFRLRPRHPGWAATVHVDMPETMRVGELLIVAARARNTGTLRWESSVSQEWPNLSLSYRVLTPEGVELPDRSERTRVGRDVLPGEFADFLCRVRVPERPGEYVFVWQLLSEHEYWFDSLGSLPAYHRATVSG